MVSKCLYQLWSFNATWGASPVLCYVPYQYLCQCLKSPDNTLEASSYTSMYQIPSSLFYAPIQSPVPGSCLLLLDPVKGPGMIPAHWSWRRVTVLDPPSFPNSLPPSHPDWPLIKCIAFPSFPVDILIWILPPNVTPPLPSVKVVLAHVHILASVCKVFDSQTIIGDKLHFNTVTRVYHCQ